MVVRVYSECNSNNDWERRRQVCILGIKVIFLNKKMVEVVLY